MAEQETWERFASLADEAGKLGLEWQRLHIDSPEHLRHACHVLDQWISDRKAGRRHWMDPLGWRPGE